MRLRKISLRIRLLRRPRFQYGLRSLLLLTLVLCIGLGWYVERVRRQRRAAALLTAMGAKVEYYDSHYGQPGLRQRIGNIWASEHPTLFCERVEYWLPSRLRDALGVDCFRPVDSVSFREAVPDYCRDLTGVRYAELDDVLDEDLANIGALSDLKRLYLPHSYISDAGLKLISQCQKLEVLDINCWHAWLPRDEGLHYTRWHKPITDAGLAPLANLRQLQGLTLLGAAVSGAGLAHLAGMSDLEVLDLSSTNLTDEGLPHLTGLRRLRRVDLSDTAVGDAGLACLANLPNLDVLDLTGTLITDDGLATLRSLPLLRRLYLRGTAITDKGLGVLVELSSLERLESIDIAETAVSKKGAAWLKERLPAITANFGEPDNLRLNHAHTTLMRAGLWRRALAALNELDRSYLDSVEGLADLGRCHAELGEWQQAEDAYFKAIEQDEWCALWEELDDWPQLYQRLARRRPKYVGRWLTSARIAVLEGDWSAAAEDFARAFEYSSGFNACPDNRRFEYGLSRLLVGDLAGHRRYCSQLYEAHKQAVEDASKNPASMSRDRIGMDYCAKRLWFFAPQGTADPFHVVEWSQDETTDLKQFSDLLPLIDCRAGKFEKALQHEGGQHGWNWFSCALAHHYLGHQAQARECFDRGARELKRRMKTARVRGNFSGAGDVLAAEVLRREAEKLIFKKSE